MTTIAVGTEKGGYLLRLHDGELDTSGPIFPGWKVTAWASTPSGSTLAALASNWFGASVHRSIDLETWEQVEVGPSYSTESGRTLNQIWTFHPTACWPGSMKRVCSRASTTVSPGHRCLP